MNKIPLPNDLPLEVHLLFWIMMLLVGAGLTISVWFLIRYILGQDKMNDDVKLKFESLSRKFEDLKQSFQQHSETIVKEIGEVQKTTFSMRKDNLSELSQIKDVMGEMKEGINETKVLTKTVETHQTVLKTIIVKLNDLIIIKSRKTDQKE